MKNYVERSESSQVGYSRLKLYEIFAKVQKQIDYDSFLPEDRQLAREIALIISEIYRLPESADVRIGGITLSAGMVAEAYEQLGYGNVDIVIASFRKISYPVRNIKTYLRTALYNSVFELEARLENSVRSGKF